ncbi:MAG: livG [Ilumatobacteraceae bacterium]|nr:livG [Ilumatobacteraceae bacterium]
MTAIIDIENLRVEFGGVVALADVSLSVSEAEIVGIIGPNGAGKSTTLNAVSGFVRPSHGTMRLNGELLERMTPAARAKNGIGRTFQTPRLFPGLTVAENLQVTSRQRRPQAMQFGTAPEVLEMCQIAQLRDVTSEQLTSGERRFAELARALMLGPSVLMLDEPATGLRTNEVHAFGGILRHLRDTFKTAALLVSHDLQIVYDCCSSVIVINEGRVLTTGTPHEVRRDPAVVRAYFGSEISDDD